MPSPTVRYRNKYIYFSERGGSSTFFFSFLRRYMCDRVEQGQRWQSFHFVTGIISLWRLCPHCVDPLFPPPPPPQPSALSIFIDNVSHGRRLPSNHPPLPPSLTHPGTSAILHHTQFVFQVFIFSATVKYISRPGRGRRFPAKPRR